MDVMLSEDMLSTEILATYATTYGLKALAAIAIFIIGRWIAKLGTSCIKSIMKKAKVDKTLIDFTGNIIYTLGLTLVIIAMLSQLGIETTSLAAVLAAAGLAIGLALQGSLSNFAAGFLIIAFRPFKAGDFVEAGGTSGVVEEITIFTTKMRTPDNKTVIVPNGNITDGVITNYSSEKTRRVDLVVGVGYSDNLSKVKKVLTKIVEKDARILKDPETVIAVCELADSSVNLVVRPWVKSVDYWPVLFDLTEEIKTTFDKEGISIPFPQRDLHIVDGGSKALKKAA